MPGIRPQAMLETPAFIIPVGEGGRLLAEQWHLADDLLAAGVRILLGAAEAEHSRRCQ